MAKGRKRTKGVPDIHDELKTRVNLSLTPKAIEGLDSRASEYLVSRSELVERLGRGLIPIAQIPSVPFSKRENLPNRPGIGLLVSGSQILHVGQGIELKRLESSRLAGLNIDDDELRIIWLECSEASWLPLIEAALVAVYKPDSESYQNSRTEVENFFRRIDSNVLDNLPTDVLQKFQRACGEALAFRGVLISSDIPNAPTIDNTPVEGGEGGGIIIRDLYSYTPPPRWLQSVNGGMYEVSGALRDNYELHKLPEDLQQRVLKLRLQEDLRPMVQLEPMEGQLEEDCEGSTSQSSS